MTITQNMAAIVNSPPLPTSSSVSITSLSNIVAAVPEYTAPIVPTTIQNPLLYLILTPPQIEIEIPQGGYSRNRSRNRNKYRNYINSLARGLKDFFKIKQRPPEPEPEDVNVEIPTPQPPAGQKITILSSPPTQQNPLPLSVFASVPKQSAISHNQKSNLDNVTYDTNPIYPLILNPLTAPLIQTKVTLPKVIKQPLIPPYRVGEGRHIDSTVVGFKKPKNRSKTASTINTLMILLEIERQV
jgi:hypothetical protein